MSNFKHVHALTGGRLMQATLSAESSLSEFSAVFYNCTKRSSDRMAITRISLVQCTCSRFEDLTLILF